MRPCHLCAEQIEHDGLGAAQKIVRKVSKTQSRVPTALKMKLDNLLPAPERGRV